VGILDRFEERIDRAVNGAFARAFASEVQPVEIASALQNEVTDRALSVSKGRTVVPNLFSVDLSPADFERLTAYADLLRNELVGTVREHISEQRYITLGPVQVEFEMDSALDTGIFRVNSEAKAGGDQEQAPQPTLSRGPHLVLDGVMQPLTRQRTVLGRGSDADIRIEDSGVSRRHCEIRLSNPPVLVDLGSTNGTWVRGERITELELSSDTDFSVGNTTVQFRMR
jgi:hypothetical protein